MKTLYFECNMGAAGDMLMSSLFELCEKKELFLTTMNQLFSPEVKLTPLKVSKNGILGTQIQVLIHGEEEGVYDFPEKKHTKEHHHHHHHASYSDILAKIKTLDLPSVVKENAAAIYQLIGDAEATVHGTTLEQIHFHEVGTLDALVDVVGCSYLIYLIAPEQILCSPIHVGSGFVKCAHGVLPVPAPATAQILKGIPSYSGEIASELCTPTGAAILKHFVHEFCSMPVFDIQAIGYGMGHKEFKTLNCVRTFWGENTPSANKDQVLEISCNIDDMTGEAIGFATELLIEQGALDVYTVPIQMKKNRPGILFVCLCNPKDKDHFTDLIFTHTTTRGMRYQSYERTKLTSSSSTVSTPYGDIRIKESVGPNIRHQKPEYDDVKKAAKTHNVSLEDVYREIRNS